MTARYEPAGTESEPEPRSRGRVLRNKLGIVKVRDMELAESQALWLAQNEAVETYAADYRFTAQDVCALHRNWLGPIYEWAGEYRTVNLGRGGFQFASATLIPELMRKFEREVLAKYTPCREGSVKEIAAALAIVHSELILIHPFRDGNGRLARLVASLMGLQAKLPALDFSALDGTGKAPYIAGIHAALAQNYAPLTATFEKAIDLTKKLAASRNR
jgi:cell filamentation protein